MGLEPFRPSRAVNTTRRWRALAFLCKRRDGFKCVQCGAVTRLEADHIKPVRTHPELGFELTNLQTLCASCHSQKTRIELGHKPITFDRRYWQKFMKQELPSC
jgi:5-methylcytosine-specific restriction enzyme A